MAYVPNVANEYTKLKRIMFHSINNPGGSHRVCEVDGDYQYPGGWKRYSMILFAFLRSTGGQSVIHNATKPPLPRGGHSPFYQPPLPRGGHSPFYQPPPPRGGSVLHLAVMYVTVKKVGFMRK